MKKILIAISFLLIVSLFVMTSDVLASPGSLPSGSENSADLLSYKKTPGPKKTPGAKATEQAEKKDGQKNGKKSKQQKVKGLISALDSSGLTLTLTDGSSVTVLLNADTKIHIPGGKKSGASLETGMNAMVMAITDADGNLTARSVMAIPGKPTRTHRVGWVTAYTPGESITIQASDGNTYTFKLIAEPKILPAERADQLAVGSRVTIIAPRIPSETDWTAVGIVVHPVGSGEGSRPPELTETATATAADTATATATATDTATPIP